jgi:8-oxo-dGTP pyrophosphatase MutT (NUDIX family)
MPEPITDFSCGVIPWRRAANGPREYLLIQHNAGHWAFPKGHPEPGESDLDTARRELAEETGITAVTLLASPTFDESYSFADPRGTPVDKTVRYFLGEVLPEAADVVLQAEEVQGSAWLNAAEARRLMTFDEGRKLLDAAEDYLGS